MYFHFIKSNLLLIVLFIWILLPIFVYDEVVRILALISIIIFSIQNFSISNKKVLFAIIVFMLYTFTINTIESNSSFLLRHLQLYIFLVLIFVSTIVMQFSTERKTQLILIILTFNLIALTGTFLGLLTDSHAARALSKSSEAGIKLSALGIGGYGSVYMNVILYPLLFVIKKTIKNNLINYLVWANLIALVLTILYANFLIAILLLSFQIIYLSINSTKGNIKFMYLLSVIIIILIAYSNIEYIEKETYSIVEGTSLRLKHSDIFSQIRGDESINGTIASRSERYARSLNIFFTNPITGSLSFDNIGKHSNILDLFAQFGFLIGFLFLSIIRKLPLTLLKKSAFGNKYYIKSLIWSIIIFGLVNNFSMQHGIVYIIIACLINNRGIDLNKIS